MASRCGSRAPRAPTALWPSGSRPQWWWISLFAYFQVEEDIRTGRLVRLLPDAEIEAVPFYVTYPARQTLPARTRMVMNWIINEAESLIGKACG
jgi:DNA-binding transcriptional LysR family regulator